MERKEVWSPVRLVTHPPELSTYELNRRESPWLGVLAPVDTSAQSDLVWTWVVDKALLDLVGLVVGERLEVREPGPDLGYDDASHGGWAS